MYYFMVFVNLLIPIFMVVVGILFLVRPPKFNSKYGFRAPKLIKNKDMWDFAHKICGMFSLMFGSISFICFSLFVYFLRIYSDSQLIFITFFLVVLQISILCFVYVLTLFCLEKKFDKNGDRK